MVQMEKLVNHCDMELMKMAMLRHEQTFRQQVHELHRLYRVQEQLMSGGGLSRPSSELISCRRQARRIRLPRRALDLRLPAADGYILGGGAHNATPPPRQEDGLELTLAVGGGGGGGRRKQRRDDKSTGTGTGTPLGSDCSGGGSLTSSSSTDTASGSPPYRRAAMPAFRLQEGAVKQPQPQQQSPWLVQCLSLNMA